MRRVMVKYRVKADRVAENERLIADVFAELANARLPVQYAAYRMPDGVSFVHVAAVELVEGKNPLVALPAFQRYVAEIGARCDEPPVSTELAAIGVFAGSPA